MKILWVSDPPEVTSAYGQQTALFLPRLWAAGHEVALLAAGCGHARQLPDGTPVLPAAHDFWGNRVVSEHARRFHADVVLTLCDPHVLSPEVYAELPWVTWAPLDFETPTLATLRALSVAKCVWSPSRHGEAAYQAAGLKNVTWVPHGVDSRVFSIFDKKDARVLLGASVGRDIPEDSFLAVSVSANRGSPSRKGFYELFAAWKIFSERHSGALLYLHTEMTGLGGVGEDLRHVMKVAGLSPDRVVFPPQYEYVCGILGPEHLAAAYQAADVYLSTSHGEGFGLPLIESQLCGTLVIAPKNTAQTETAGRLVESVSYMPFDGATLWGRPSVSDLVEALEEAKTIAFGLDWPAGRPRWFDRRECIFSYDVDRVFSEKFLPALEEAHDGR